MVQDSEKETKGNQFLSTSGWVGEKFLVHRLNCRTTWKDSDTELSSLKRVSSPVQTEQATSRTVSILRTTHLLTFTGYQGSPNLYVKKQFLKVRSADEVRGHGSSTDIRGSSTTVMGAKKEVEVRTDFLLPS